MIVEISGRYYAHRSSKDPKAQQNFQIICKSYKVNLFSDLELKKISDIEFFFQTNLSWNWKQFFYVSISRIKQQQIIHPSPPNKKKMQLNDSKKSKFLGFFFLNEYLLCFGDPNVKTRIFVLFMYRNLCCLQLYNGVVTHIHIYVS